MKAESSLFHPLVFQGQIMFRIKIPEKRDSNSVAQIEFFGVACILAKFGGKKTGFSTACGGPCQEREIKNRNPLDFQKSMLA